MSQQGGRPTGQEDDWWRQLYDDSTGDTGPAPAPDSLDDRFASAAGAVGERADPGSGGATGDERSVSGPARPGRADEGPVSGAGSPGARSGSHDGESAVPGTRAADVDAEPVVPVPRTRNADALDTPRPTDPAPQRAPWEPPPARPTGPVTFPTAATPTGHADLSPAPTRPTDLSPPPPRPTGPPQAPPRQTGPPPAPPRPTDPPPAPPHQTGPPPAPPRPTVPPPDQAEPWIEPLASATRQRGHVGSRPPTYDAEPTALPAADPDDLGDLVADTVLDGARYGSCTLRAVSLRGDSARYRGEPRRDSLLTARFGVGEQALLLVAMATGARAAPGAHRVAAEACIWIGRAVGRSHLRLVEDIRAGRRGDLKSGLHRLTDRTLGKLRAGAAERGVDPEEYAASLRCLLLSADPECRTRVFFGVGPGGLFRLRDGEWQDIEPQVVEVRGEPVLGFGSPPAETPEGDRLTMDLGIPTPPSPYEPAPEPPREPFRFRTSVARPGDTLLMCSGGFADPLRGEPELGEYLADRWSRTEPPGLAAFLADSQVRVKGYADDRTVAAVWEA
ncbi:protein phosphatase 2C domain-containing protein [Streptomyces sp. NRRL S-474]|uniref:protein phosphatase 2C domain-containing protein n=1 Tax=Streptomyces sp. NRRL S-474 TaxID=1463909 RepID=UPI00099C383F|nr:protein phosphatase 2C domain-containing protein [Streptomyces sp. NRRL S-474]